MWAKKVPCLFPKEKYYFLTDEIVEKSFISLYDASSIKIVDRTVEQMPEKGPCTVVPRTLIDGFNPSTLRVSVTINSEGNRTINFGWTTLGNFLDASFWGNSKYLTWSFLTGGDPAIDNGDEIILLGAGTRIKKFQDTEAWYKMTDAFNRLFKQNNMKSKVTFQLKGESASGTLDVEMMFPLAFRDVLSSKESGRI